MDAIEKYYPLVKKAIDNAIVDFNKGEKDPTAISVNLTGFCNTLFELCDNDEGIEDVPVLQKMAVYYAYLRNKDWPNDQRFRFLVAPNLADKQYNAIIKEYDAIYNKLKKKTKSPPTYKELDEAIKKHQKAKTAKELAKQEFDYFAH